MTQCAADIRVAWLVYLLVYVSTYCVPITTLNQNKQNSITLFGRRPNNLHRRVTQPKRVTSPTWGPPPPCKQALRSAKQQLFTCITLFCTFLCRRCTSTTWNCLVSLRMKDGSTRQRFSFSFGSQIESFRIQLLKTWPAYDNLEELEWERMNCLKLRKSYFWVKFSLPLSLLKVPNLIVLPHF